VTGHPNPKSIATYFVREGVMFSQTWSTSKRQFGIAHERHVSIPVSAGFTLDAEVFRPDAPGRFPVILGAHPYSQADQIAPMMPIGQGGRRGHIEMGDYNFYVRRGYAHLVLNLRGTGRSGGLFDHAGPGTIQDVCDAIEWLAAQPWSDGNVGMLGLSYFSIVAKRTAAVAPRSLKTVFCPYGVTDMYRDWHYHGGILSHGMFLRWVGKPDRMRLDPLSARRQLGDEEYERRLDRARQDDELLAVPGFAAALVDPEKDRNAFIVNILLNHVWGSYFEERAIPLDANIKTPAYLGSCWGIYGLHLPGDARSWEHFTGPKKLTIGPPVYLDRPFYQYQSESLRWFDHWLKGIDTGLLDEPPVGVFIDGSARWKTSTSWPLPETKWEEFYLHENGLLSEHEPWPNEGHSTFGDSPYAREGLAFTTPPILEETEICGPIVLNLQASTTGTEVLWFASLWEVAPHDQERLLTRGWLRGTQRHLDPAKSRPWQPYHAHDRREPLVPNEVYNFSIEIRPYGLLLKSGFRLRLKIRCSDDEQPGNHLHAIAAGHVLSQESTRVTVYHDAERPSYLLLPITSGNRIGTFMSGGII
jgi:predicted acyl esterase